MSASTDVTTRIHDDKVIIDPVRVRQFFSARARHAESDHPLAAALLSDRRPALAQARDQYERSFAMTLLELGGEEDLLDVGCGIGRWTGSLLPRVRAYVGIDYTPSLLEVARETHPQARFEQVDAATELDLEALGRDRGFDRIVIANLLSYLNDGAATRALRRVARVSAPSARIYLSTPVSLSSRLTLRGEWSDDLCEEYHAIYRPAAQLDDLLEATLRIAGFQLEEAGDLFPASLNTWSDTRHQYQIWQRG